MRLALQSAATTILMLRLTCLLTWNFPSDYSTLTNMNCYILSDYLLLRNHNLAAELAVDDRPPRDKGELMGFLDHGELAAR